MTYVVCEPCIDCKFTECVQVCPANCFYQGETQLYINPAECIDCGACVPECPVSAIFAEDEVPDQWKDYTASNASDWEGLDVITTKQDPLPTAEAKKQRLGK